MLFGWLNKKWVRDRDVHYSWTAWNTCQELKRYSFPCRSSPPVGPPHCRDCTITLRHSTLCRIPLDEWSARHRDLYLTEGIRTRNHRKRATTDPRLRPHGHWDRSSEIPHENWSQRRSSVRREEWFKVFRKRRWMYGFSWLIIDTSV
jgi:hypothetical protein